MTEVTWHFWAQASVDWWFPLLVAKNTVEVLPIRLTTLRLLCRRSQLAFPAKFSLPPHPYQGVDLGVKTLDYLLDATWHRRIAWLGTVGIP